MEKVLAAINLKVVDGFHDPSTEWMVVLCLTFDLLVFSVLEQRAKGVPFLRCQNPNMWLLSLVWIALFRSVLGYQTIGRAPELLVFVTNMVCAKGISLWVTGIFEFRNIGEPGYPFERAKTRAQRTYRIILILLTLLLASAFWQSEGERKFQYLGIFRRTGVWDNPNTFGLLMGVAAILVGGQAIQFSNSEPQMGSSKRQRRLWILLWCFAAIACGAGLFKSYSRGAWLGTAIGLGYQLWSKAQSPKPKASRQGWRLMHSFPLLLLSIAILSFWQFRFTEWSPARRVFSVANVNDFSWRNRVTAWQGAIRMMADRPFVGFGWRQAEKVYEERYRSPELENGAAIQLNDYFMLGISAGVPALICFVAYVGLSLRSRACSVFRVPYTWVAGRGVSEEHALDWMRMVCRAGAIVLLVGFWFDGGLFKLATGSVFWILLELGREEVQSPKSKVQSLSNAECGVRDADFEISNSICLRPTSARQEFQVHSSADCEVRIADWENSNAKEQECAEGGIGSTSEVGERRTRSDAPYLRGFAERWLKRFAWTVAVVALMETIVLVGTPFLPVNRATLAIARRWLVPPKAVGDLDFLVNGTLGVTRPTLWNQCKLRVLLQHASLANYNRQLVNWSVDDEVYQDYVLSPDVFNEEGIMQNEEDEIRNPKSEIPARVEDLNWRRMLWEYFYPPVRHENDPMAAAEIVVKFLCQRVSVVHQGPLTIEEMWKERRANEEGFEALKVAAFRSVGIPARLNENGKVELFVDGKWQAVP